ncbi:MAG TPA: GxxExxY protein [Holophagaceae bacterium]|nr:GxxExxY protein [Holophagaceae bacterium]
MDHQDTKTPRKDLEPRLEELAATIVDSAIKVHRSLGPGLLENVYEVCLIRELTTRGLKVQRQVSLPVFYEGLELDAGLRLDLLVEGDVVIELKAVEAILPVHHAQLLTYLKLADKRLGFLINFNSPVLKDGIHRRIL